MIYDVAVIGAGVFGAWTAHHLVRAGVRVVLLDIYGAANSRASSGGESRIIRMGYGADEIYTRSAMRSLGLWLDFCERTGLPLFRQTGVLWTAAEGDTYSLSTRQTLSRCGVRFELLAPAALETRFPQMQFAPGAYGILEPESGAIMARQAVHAVVEDAVRGGMTYLAATRPDAVIARTYVYACGPWLSKIFPELLGSRIVPTRQEVFFFGAPAGDPRFRPPAMPVWIDFSDPRGPYGFPDLDGRGVKIALDRHGEVADPDSLDRVPNAEGLAEARACLEARFPALRGAPVIEARVCQYENTSNGDFLIDRHPDLEDVWLVGGGSGHGFKHGPAVGEYAAARILGGGTAEPRYSLVTKAESQNRTVF